MNAMILQPMRDMTDEKIRATRNKAASKLNAMGYELVDTLFACDPRDFLVGGRRNCGRIDTIGLWYLSMSIERMTDCDAVFLCKGWEGELECVVAHDVALVYGLKVLYDDFGEEV